MRRRRSTPWIQRWSRPAIAVVATVGALVTGYLTLSKLFTGSVACPTEGCDTVLNSPYAYVFGIPLTLFGFLAYVGMGSSAVAPFLVGGGNSKQLRSDLDRWTGNLLLVGGTAMTVFSGYLMYLLAFELRELCVYCIASASFSLSFLILSAFGREWEDPGQALFNGFIVAAIAVVGSIALYASTGDKPVATNSGQLPPPVTTISTADAEALAIYLTETGVKEYGAFWCPHCHDQKQLFGKTAAAKLNYIECDPRGVNAQPDLCREAGISSFPTWQIDGKLYPGVKPLEQLSDLANYDGPQNFVPASP